MHFFFKCCLGFAFVNLDPKNTEKFFVLNDPVLLILWSLCNSAVFYASRRLGQMLIKASSGPKHLDNICHKELCPKTFIFCQLQWRWAYFQLTVFTVMAGGGDTHHIEANKQPFAEHTPCAKFKRNGVREDAKMWFWRSAPHGDSTTGGNTANNISSANAKLCS